MGASRITNPIVLLAIVPLAWLVSRLLWTCDDAHISFRYVRHLVHGDGLVFNPGELPPFVIGSSAGLETLACALPAVGIGRYFVWRYSYFREWLPNTAKVKAGFSFLRLKWGWKYLATLVSAAPALGLMPLLTRLAWRRVRSEARYAVRGKIGAVGYHSELASFDIDGQVIPDVAEAGTELRLLRDVRFAEHDPGAKAGGQ